MKFTEDNIFLNLEVATKEELFSILSKQALISGYVKDDELAYQAFIKREDEFSTGLQDGFAIPHAKDESIIEATVFFAKLTNSIEWETFDDTGVQYVFALLVPKEEEGTAHIQMLSQLATALMEDDFRTHIKDAKEKTQLVSIINKEMIGVEIR